MSEKLDRLIQAVRERWVPEFQLQRFEHSPWNPMRKPLKDSKGALIGTGGIYVKGDTPFTDHYGLGDPSYREIPVDTPNLQLAHFHEHYDHSNANEDINCIFPLEHMKSLVEEGFIGTLSDYHYSFMGYIPIPHPLVTRTAPDLVRKLKMQEVDFALIVPT